MENNSKEATIKRYIHDVESSDSPIGPTLRAIYDTNEFEKCMEQLDARIKQHDRDIERMCNFHYQGFIDSIHELLQVRNDAEQIKKNMMLTNQGIQEAGSLLSKQAKEIVKNRQVQENITVIIEQIQTVLPVIGVYMKLKEQMRIKRYYSALKTLEQLEHTHLPQANKYRFIQMMMETIPVLREQIKQASMADLNYFLENIRKHSARIGDVAMKHAAEQQELIQADPSVTRKRLHKRRAPPAPHHSSSSPSHQRLETLIITGGDAATGIDNTEDDDDDVSAQELIDFSPVYRCLHIHTVLGAREEFENYYRKQRKKQVRLCLNPPQNMQGTFQHDTLQVYMKYFHEIVGFFVIEDHIKNTAGPGLVTKPILDELWDMALKKIKAVLTTHSAYCNEATLLLQIKQAIILFSQTLQGYGYSISALYELLGEMRDQYSEMLMSRWAPHFDAIFTEDQYTPLTVDTAAEWAELVAKYPPAASAGRPAADPTAATASAQPADAPQQVTLPKRFPFSSFVPRVYDEIKAYIIDCYKFCADMNVRSADAGSVVAKLQGAALFKDIRSEAEEQIYYQLNNKIDEFLSLANYNWMLEESRGHASGYLMDLIAFLESTFLSFTNLPVKVAQRACMSACRHIGNSMMSLLLDPDLKQITVGALQQFNLDVIQCEQFANREPVQGFKDGVLQMCFIELRQLLDLFLLDDWSSYLADFGQSTNKYLRVQPRVAKLLLEKLKEGEKRKKSLFITNKPERDRKKLMDQVYKQLTALALNPQAAS